MHDHHPRYDRPDIGVRRPGKVFLPEEREPEKRGARRLHQFIFLLLFVVGLAVLYYTIKERGPDFLKRAAPELVKPDSR